MVFVKIVFYSHLFFKMFTFQERLDRKTQLVAMWVQKGPTERHLNFDWIDIVDKDYFLEYDQTPTALSGMCLFWTFELTDPEPEFWVTKESFKIVSQLSRMFRNILV